MCKIITNGSFLSRTVAELSQLIIQILDTLRFEPHFGAPSDNVRCSSWAHWKACVSAN